VTPARAFASAALAMIGIAAAAVVSTQPAPQTFTATASVKKGGVSASAPFTVTIVRYSPEADREAVIAAVRHGGTTAARLVLARLGDAGFVQLGERRVAVKFAAERPTGSGRLVTVVTAEPVLFLGAGIPEAKPRDGFDVAVAMLDVPEAGGGVGEFVPAARIGLDAHGALLIEDYGATVVWLGNLAHAR